MFDMEKGKEYILIVLPCYVPKHVFYQVTK